MGEKIQSRQLKETQRFPANGNIQETVIWKTTEAYPVGEKEFVILKQQYWVDWLNPLAGASFGVLISHLYNLLFLMYQIYNGSVQKVTTVNDEILKSKMITICSFAVLVILLILNKFMPTEKKRLLKDIRKVLDSNPRISASQRKGQTCD